LQREKDKPRKKIILIKLIKINKNGILGQNSTDTCKYFIFEKKKVHLNCYVLKTQVERTGCQSSLDSLDSGTLTFPDFVINFVSPTPPTSPLGPLCF
jgi:hypothetical protein